MNSVPAAIASGIICLMLGVAAGAGGMMAVGWKVERTADVPPEGASGPSRPPGPMGGGPGGGGGGGAGGPGGGGGGQRGPSPKMQLATLVNKLDQLTQKSLHVELTADEKMKIHEQLQGLADKDELSDDDAKKHLETLLEILKDKKETMEAAGYRWPGAGGGAGGGGPAAGGPPPNPFKTEANAKALKSLDALVAK